MKRDLRMLAAALLLFAASTGGPAFAQKQGGILKMSHFDSPASMSMHEEATAAANRPMMGVFNNLVMYSRTRRRTACNRSCPTWRSTGHGARTAPN